MNFEQFTVLPSLLAGAGIVAVLWGLLDKGGSNKSTAQHFVSDSSEEVAKLQAELAQVKEEADKVADLHSYTRQLETKVQLLEAANAEPGSEEHEMRVKVLEQQLSEKAALEAKLAATQQELSDLQSKFEMHQAMAPEAPVAVAQAPSPTATPVATDEAQPVSEPVVEEPAATEAVAETAPEAAPEPAPEPVMEAKPVVEVAAPVETAPSPEEFLTTSASSQVEIEVVQNDNPITMPSQPMVASGGAAAAAKLDPVEDRPALRVEIPTPVAISDNRDPLEDIDGIGPVYQQKLYEAGIKTFAQLAAASPSRITEVIEPQNWQHIDVMKWRREAALYAAGEKS